MLQAVFPRVLERSLCVSVVLLAVMGLLPFLQKRYRPQFNCLVWTALALCLLIPFSLPRTKQAVVTIDWESLIAQEEQRMDGFSQQVNHPVQTQESIVAPSSAGWLDALPAVWAAGAGAVLAVQGGSYLLTRRRLLRWSTAVEEEKTLLLFSRCRQELGVQDRVRLLRCCLLDTPLLMGAVRPCVVLPQIELDERQMRFVLLHELAHDRRRDLWLKFLLLAAKAVHWFNPLVWWMAKRACADIEVACDADVLRLHDTEQERREYGALILSFLQRSRGRAIPLTTNFSEKGQLIRRFQEMLDTKKKRLGMLLFVLIAAAAVGSTAFVSLHAQAEKEPDLQLSEPMQQEMNILAAERAQTQQALDGQEEEEAARRAEIAKQYALYEPYGMTYDVEKDRFFYSGQMVRYFKDQLSVDYTNGFYYADGVIDVKPVRDSGGALIGLQQASDEEFAERTQQQQQMDAEFAAAGVAGESGSVELGDPSQPDDSLNDYRSFGVSYQASTGHWMYEGQPIHILYDKDHYTFCDNGVSGGVSLTVSRDASGNIERLVPTDAEQLQEYVSAELGDPAPHDDRLNDYRPFGVSYQASTGDWLYEGQPIHILYDGRHFDFQDDGTRKEGLTLVVYRNEDDEIERVVPAEGEELEEYLDTYKPIQVRPDLGPGEEWVWPVPSTHEIGCPYGLRYDNTDFHSGLDIGDYSQEIYGEPVVAAADGTVAMAAKDWTPGRGYGMYLVIEHENGFATLYGHLSSIDVEEGDTVKAGDQIGQIGATGFATGPHLHFEVRRDGEHLDPTEYLTVGKE